MLRTLRRWALVLILTTALFVGLAPAYAGGSLSPRQMMIAYYDAINRRDYLTAYNQWITPPSSYDQFVAGYATTTRVDAYFGSLQPYLTEAAAGSIPAVLIGYHSDGSVVAFSGCYDLIYNGNESGIRSWLISGADIAPLAVVPPANDIAGFINGTCHERYQAQGGYLIPQGVLLDYYDAINRRDYPTAYNLWAAPLQTYQQFADGFADTTEAVLFYGGYQPDGTQANRVPVVVFGYHTDGSLAAYSGCFFLAYTPSTLWQWRIAGADLRLMASPPSVLAISQALRASCF
jgi:hypothetical protein